MFELSVDLRLRTHMLVKQLRGGLPSQRSDQDEFYQLLDYTDDVDLRQKLAEWEQFYNFSRPHGAFNGKTPYEALREKL